MKQLVQNLNSVLDSNLVVAIELPTDTTIAPNVHVPNVCVPNVHGPNVHVPKDHGPFSRTV